MTGRRRQSNPPTWYVILLLILALLLFLYRRGFFGPAPAQVPTPVTGQPTKPSATAVATTAPANTPPSAPSQATNAAPSAAPATWYELYFTTPQYPDKPEYHHGSLDEHLVAFINTALKTIDLADYDFDLENVANALAQAAQRGVRVRMVTDTDTLTNEKNEAVQKAFSILKKAKIPIVDDQRGPIMHNKFLVVDNAAVWTGSWNFTDGDTYHLNNNGIKIMSPELAQNYTAEFEKMFVQHTFGPNKTPGVPHPVLTINGVHVENYFAAEDHVADHIVQHLQQAQQSIHFLAFSFTSTVIGDAVRARAKAGVKVAGVFETTGSETKFSEFGRMKQAGLDVLQDGNPYVMHHKVFIVDGREVLFGSFNFSNNADKDNDENLLIVDDPQIAAAFEAEFQRVRAVALHPLKK